MSGTAVMETQGEQEVTEHKVLRLQCLSGGGVTANLNCLEFERNSNIQLKIAVLKPRVSLFGFMV